MKWVITGGCGFIGCSLVARLVAEGNHSIRVADNLSVGSKEDLSLASAFIESPPRRSWKANEVNLCVGDVREKSFVNELQMGADVVVHLAASTGVAPSVEDPYCDFDHNALGTLNVLEGARKNDGQRVVFASSGAPLGMQTPPLHEKLAPLPASPYGASKLAGEGYCIAYYHCFGVETVALRFGNVYGPGSGRKQSVVAKFIKQAMAGEVLEVYGNGSQTRDFIYITDLVDAVYKAAMAKNVGGEIFQIATSCETTIQELIESLVFVLGTLGLDSPGVHYGEHRVGDVPRNFADTSKALSMLKWEADTTLIEGLERTLQYFLGSHDRRTL